MVLRLFLGVRGGCLRLVFKSFFLERSIRRVNLSDVFWEKSNVFGCACGSAGAGLLVSWE